MDGRCNCGECTTFDILNQRGSAARERRPTVKIAPQTNAELVYGDDDRDFMDDVKWDRESRR